MSRFYGKKPAVKPVVVVPLPAAVVPLPAAVKPLPAVVVPLPAAVEPAHVEEDFDITEEMEEEIDGEEEND